MGWEEVGCSGVLPGAPSTQKGLSEAGEQNTISCNRAVVLHFRGGEWLARRQGPGRGSALTHWESHVCPGRGAGVGGRLVQSSCSGRAALDHWDHYHGDSITSLLPREPWIGQNTGRSLQTRGPTQPHTETKTLNSENCPRGGQSSIRVQTSHGSDPWLWCSGTCSS